MKLAKQLTGYKCGLIQVPYSLNVISNSDLFSSIFHFNKIPSLSFKHPHQLIKAKRNVNELIKPAKNDILLVHVERDLINQYIIQLFHGVRAKIYLLEDGIATMCHFNMVFRKPSLVNRIKNVILKKIFKFSHTKIGLYGYETLHIMDDYLFDGLIVNHGNIINRNIPLFKLSPLVDPINIKYEEGALFLNQPMYLGYNKENEYLHYLNNVLTISPKFDPFYFKFHPSESNCVKAAITKLIGERYSNIIIIHENNIAENLMSKYAVKYLITFNSTAALNLIGSGVVPIFLNSLFNNTFPHQSLVAFNQFLKSIKCLFPLNLSEVRPGFCALNNSNLNENTKSIHEILNLHND